MEDQDGAELCFPQLLNVSCRKPKTSQSDFVLMYLLFFTSVFTVTLNLLVIISVSHFRQLHTPSNLLILSLSVSDFLSGLVSPVEAQRQTTCWFVGDLLCSLHVYVASISLSASVGVMVLISVDRYMAICDPLHYPTRVTVTRVKIIVFFTFFIPITVIIILYMRVFVTAVSQARAMRSHVAAVSLQCSGTVTTKKSELKAARTLGVVVLVFLMCFCPYFCLSLIQLDPLSGLPAASGVFLLFMGPCLNPVIYALFYPWFRKALRLIFSLQILQPGSRETNML
ncbi:hypothetical protein Q5P01_013945 [Channa striata]|uniref:G-protein coupled receptors family 1 profile domain-containing protein n=1 Tax=Channa striata TaxID=64152 RepID=A0AA88MNB7_CHASR|nr:hypothetical protein Q5P01_013945 [Channa striata]